MQAEVSDTISASKWHAADGLRPRLMQGVGPHKHEFHLHQPAHKRSPHERFSRAYRSRAVATWKVPIGMTCLVHAFDAREARHVRRGGG